MRKLRWGGSGRGKRGGLRIIDYWRNQAGQIWLLTLYAKNERANVPPHILRAIAEDIEDVRAAEDALRKIESGEDTVISLDEFLRDDLAR